MTSIDRDRIAAAVRELLMAIGEDPDRENLRDTPARVAESYLEFYSGVGVDAAAHLRETYPVEEGTKSEPVLVRGISFRSICEHHLLPFVGTAHVAYIPSDRIVGLGRLAAVVDTIASRPQLQERLGEEIAATIEEALGARGVLVVLDAAHDCVRTRGSRQTGSTTVTIASRGELASPAARAELVALIGGTE